MSTRNQSLIIYPNRDSTELKIVSNQVTTNNSSSKNLPPFYTEDSAQNVACILNDNNNNNIAQQIYAIDSCMFDETCYLSVNDNDNSQPVYTSINYEQTRLVTYALELNTPGAAGTSKRLATAIKPRRLYQLDASSSDLAFGVGSGGSGGGAATRVFKSHALSRLIAGETVVLVDDELYLMTTDRATGSRPMRLARDLAPKYAASPPWTQSIRFADFTHPRALLYTDSSQYLSIDCRIRHHSDRKDLWTFDLQRACLEPNETILQTSIEITFKTTFKYKQLLLFCCCC